ncbi:MAG: hypothetical protein ACAH35_03055 [Candidatus Paceibacterota bacterium]
MTPETVSLYITLILFGVLATYGAYALRNKIAKSTAGSVGWVSNALYKRTRFILGMEHFEWNKESVGWSVRKFANPHWLTFKPTYQLASATAYFRALVEKDVNSLSLDQFIFQNPPSYSLVVSIQNTLDANKRLLIADHASWEVFGFWTPELEILHVVSRSWSSGTVGIPLLERTDAGAANAVIDFLVANGSNSYSAVKETFLRRMSEQIDRSGQFTNPAGLQNVIVTNSDMLLKDCGWNASLDEVVTFLARVGKPTFLNTVTPVSTTDLSRTNV